GPVGVRERTDDGRARDGVVGWRRREHGRAEPSEEQPRCGHHARAGKLTSGRVHRPSLTVAVAAASPHWIPSHPDAFASTVTGRPAASFPFSPPTVAHHAAGC